MLWCMYHGLLLLVKYMGIWSEILFLKPWSWQQHHLFSLKAYVDNHSRSILVLWINQSTALQNVSAVFFADQNIRVVRQCPAISDGLFHQLSFLHTYDEV